MKLVVRLSTFYSPGDEEALFAWLRSLKCVGGLEGEARDLHIALKRRPGATELRELIGVFMRYGLDMAPLAALKTPRNAAWFDDPAAFWHKRVFRRARTRRA